MALGSVGELKEKLPSGELIEVRYSGAYPAGIEDELRSSFKPAQVVVDKGYIAIRVQNAKRRVAEILRLLVERSVSIETVSIREPTLDDVLLYHTKKRISSWHSSRRLCMILAKHLERPWALAAFHGQACV